MIEAVGNDGSVCLLFIYNLCDLYTFLNLLFLKLGIRWI